MFANRRAVRSAAQRAIANMICNETLESRVLFAATAPTTPPEDIADKIDQRFYQVAVDVERNNVKNNHWIQDGIVKLDAQGRIDTYIHTSGDPIEFLPEFKRLGAEVTVLDRTVKTAQAWIPADKLDDIARLAVVTNVGQVDYPLFNNVTSAGDGVLLADKVRSQFAAYGIDGTGVKIGVISDGVKDMLAVGNELPAVTVHPYHTGAGNEGTAMLEIVHDLAPGAQLYFSAPSSSLDMVSSINYLAGQGCNVIVDDVSFLNESYFSDSSIANAASNVISQGVVYVSAAGNFSDHGHYQAQYSPSQSAYNGGLLHKFGANQDHVEFNINPGTNFRGFLEWSDQPGQSANNYDLYLYDGDTFTQLDSSVMVQNGNDQPFEMVDWTNNTNKVVHAQIWINKKSAAANRELELFTIGNSGLNYQTTGDAIFGQQAVSGVITVAAAYAGTPNTVESYSSRGDTTIYSNFATQTKALRQTLDGTAIDGVQTKIGQLGIWPHNPFYGTSAAAPHAAAIAALIKQAKFSLTPAQISDAMTTTATDIDAPGYDVNSGYGRFNALDAVYSVFTPEKPDLTDASDTGTSNTDNLTKTTLPTFTGNVPAGSYVRLFVDGVQSSQIQLAAGISTYSLQAGAALSYGQHDITIRVASSASVPLAENSNFSPALTITIDATAPVIINNTAYNYDAPGQSLFYQFSENLSSVLTPASLVLTNTATNVAIPAADIFISYGMNNTVYFSFNNYQYGALPNGNYHATFAPGVTDMAGNPLVLGNGFDFSVLAGDANHDNTVNFADLVKVAQNYGSSNKLWADGDFTADGNVDFADMVIVAQNYGQSLPAPASPVQMPDPGQSMVMSTPAKKLLKTQVFNVTTPIRPQLRGSVGRLTKLNLK